MTAPDPADTRANPPKAPTDETLSDDAFLGGALRLYQPKTGYRAGIDAVLLAATVPTQLKRAKNSKGHAKILDVGAGVGTVGMCVARRIKTAHVTLVEKSPDLVAIALRNSTLNNLDDRLEIATADISAPVRRTHPATLIEGAYDYVLANPPFHNIGEGTPASSELKSSAHAMDEADLDRWLRFMTRMSAPGGTIALIHKADALAHLLDTMRGRFGAIRILPIHPREQKAANRVIVTGIKGSRAGLTICPGLILHTHTHQFTATVDAILRGGSGLEILW